MANYFQPPMPQVGIAPGQVGAWLDRQLPVQRVPQPWRPWLHQGPAQVRGRGIRLPTRVVPYPRPARVLRDVPLQPLAVIPPPPPPVGEPIVVPVAPPPPPPPAAVAAEPAAPVVPPANIAEPEEPDNEGMGAVLSSQVLRLARMVIDGSIKCVFRVHYTNQAVDRIPQLVRLQTHEPSSVLIAFVMTQVMSPGNALADPLPDDRGYPTTSEESEGSADESD